MQLDKTRVVIRERDTLDIFDVTLHVVREYWNPLIVTFFAGALPWWLLNHLLLRWMAIDDFAEEPILAYLHYVVAMSLLITIEAPLASVFTTLYLGGAMFHNKPTYWHLVREAWILSPRWLVFQGILRGILPTMLLIVVLPREGEPYKWIVQCTLIMAVFGTGILRAIRPFLMEVILLERTPVRQKNPSTVTLSRRMSTLHVAASGDLFIRWFCAAAFAVALTFSILIMFWCVSWIVENGSKLGPFFVFIGAPAAMWFAAIYFSVARFLGYLDCRIRSEGWEVELQLRAAANRLVQQSQ